MNPTKGPTMCLNMLYVPRLERMDIRVIIEDGGSTFGEALNDDTQAHATLGETGLSTVNSKIVTDVESMTVAGTFGGQMSL